MRRRKKSIYSPASRRGKNRRLAIRDSNPAGGIFSTLMMKREGGGRGGGYIGLISLLRGHKRRRRRRKRISKNKRGSKIWRGKEGNSHAHEGIWVE